MNRDTFEKFVLDNLIDITYNEINYLQSIDRQFAIRSPLIMSNKISYDKENLKKPLGDLYYLYDKHKNLCKDYLGDHSVRLDRHKTAAILMCAVLEFEPIKYFSAHKDRLPSIEVILANARIAFRFACAYAVSALYTSFCYKLETYTKQGNIEEAHQYEYIIEKFTEKASYFFPKTRDGLPNYIDNYVKVIFLEFNKWQIGNEDNEISYALLSDTFYWLDIFAKLNLGLKVEVTDDKLDGGLIRQIPTNL